MDILLKPARLATSKPAQRTYLNTLLLLLSSTVLLGVAIVAYWLFYFAYIPQIGISRVVHLQYGDGPHPYGLAPLASSLIAQQPYDISLTLHMPLSTPNLSRGNFMLSISLLRPSYIPPPLPPAHSSHLKATTQLLHPNPIAALSKSDILYVSRRPALLTYKSELISLTSRLLALPLYMLGLRQESEVLHIPMFEKLEFARGKANVPEYIMLEVQSGQDVQVYNVIATFTARFGGIRWVMYNYRITAFVVFTGLFWGMEVIGLLLSWFLLRTIFSTSSPSPPLSSGKEKQTIEDSMFKTETEDAESEQLELSDTERTFPTYGRQKPLKYEGKIKVESGEDVLDEVLGQMGVVEADDEDDEEGLPGSARDSGLGTSFSEGGAGRGLVRKRSRGGRFGGSGGI